MRLMVTSEKTYKSKGVKKHKKFLMKLTKMSN